MDSSLSPVDDFPGTIPEADLARALNVSRADLRRIRSHLSPTDFISRNGSKILITFEGQTRIAELLKNNAPSAPGAPPVLAEPVREHYVTLTVVKVLPPRMLRAKKNDAEGHEVRVRVRCVENFIPGMLLPKCEADREHADLYFYHGRYPRYRGQRLTPR